MKYNVILDTDSYKLSMFTQYPPGTKYVYSYIESRGGEYDKTIMFGLQAFLKEYMSQPITARMIRRAKAIAKAHGEPFNEEGWDYILNVHKGVLPLEIRSVDEGTVIEPGHVLVTVVNTDPMCGWLTSYTETRLLRAVWYGTTVASNSYNSKQIILKFLEQTGDPSMINFKLHDFGARGVNTWEGSLLGGMAHLVPFMGTDTIACLEAIMEYYNTEEVMGFSIPASEHSTITSWGRDHEVDAYRNMLVQFAKPGALVACVSDSYDIFEACKLWGTVLKDEVINSGATLVIRPDSGTPSFVVVECARILDKYFGSTMNSKGFKVLNHVRIIQGDGITAKEIYSILFCLQLAGYSADNVAFGQGGALLQQVNRDTLKMAMKCSAIYIESDDDVGEWRDVYKDPVTDSGKRSKRGRLSLVKRDGKYVTVPLLDDKTTVEQDLLKLRWKNGEMFNETTFQEVRARQAA